MKKSISTEPTPENITQVLDLLAEMPDRLERLAKDPTDPQLHQPLRPGERSFTETLAHLIYCEDRSSEAIYLALIMNEPLMPEVHPERQWGKLLRYDLLKFSDLRLYFRMRRGVLVRILRSLSAAQWARLICEAGKKRKESVYWRARSMALHELEHLSDLEATLITG
ncbi:MAG TPA: DinB family protein [Anaerolineales bacterium]|nr:DinB family protein [Anaerolineales bacterium]